MNYNTKEGSISPEIKEVLQAIKIVLNVKDWKNFPEIIRKIKKEGIKEPPSQQELRRLEKITKKRDFTFQVMSKKSMAVGNFTSWIQKLES